MSVLLWSLLGVVAGMLISLQAPINAQLAHGLGMPLAAAAASFVAGAVMLIAVTVVVQQASGTTITWSVPPLWMFIAGGCLGAGYILCAIILTPRIGTAAMMAFVVSGQLIAGLLLDKLGYFGLAVRELTLGRVTGACLLVLGALLIRFT
ncbi:MAG: DMT family transporter [Hyphomicrobium sp.]|jgi:transporter family-2 protein